MEKKNNTNRTESENHENAIAYQMIVNMLEHLSASFRTTALSGTDLLNKFSNSFITAMQELKTTTDSEAEKTKIANQLSDYYTEKRQFITKRIEYCEQISDTAMHLKTLLAKEREFILSNQLNNNDKEFIEKNNNENNDNSIIS